MNILLSIRVLLGRSVLRRRHVTIDVPIVGNRRRIVKVLSIDVLLQETQGSIPT